MSRPGLAALLAAAVALAVAPAASATPILDEADATELAGVLAEAEASQDICYGWEVTISGDVSTALAAGEYGSSRGPDTHAVVCDQYVIFEADLVYTSESSEAADRASFRVSSNLPGAPSEADLRRVGVDGGRLLGNDDDRAIYDATVALPALVAERGLAPPVAAEANRDELPPGDGPRGGGGSDWLRTNGDPLAVILIVLIGGLAWAAWILLFRRASLSQRD